ncbi:MAG: phenylalanine--tRNA ligase subunit beta [Gammaproteobacteria bacterium]|nr:phenylalanine--tRNA ligase subunit beta [Gammaproteobacteria bacterium]
MIFSESWLREWVDVPVGGVELAESLTMAGLEVGARTPVAGEFSGVVVAEVTAVEAHPEAESLYVCQVDDGVSSHQVVCGAPNTRIGLKTPYARVGAGFRQAGDDGGDKEVGAADIRGVESSGMLCSAEELGMAESSDGLLELPVDAPAGADIRDYLALDDNSIELDLTPNRGDCLGMLGLARDVGAMMRLDVAMPPDSNPAVTLEDEFPVRISAGKECPRYLGRIVRGIDLNAETPMWMQEKLRRGGLRCIDPVVDVTNFVLLELGQPLHAFDFGKLQKHIDVRLARPGEKLTLLDGKELELQPDTLVIADGAGAVAMAGIMGGMNTAVSEQTSDVFLECASFAPFAVAGRGRAVGLQTDAQQRYERGVDYLLQHRAMARATELLLEIAGGEAGPVTEALGEIPEARQVRLKFASIARVLGVEIPREDVLDILTRLGFAVLEESAEDVAVEVPSYRYDVAIEADLLEELARIHGYDKLPLAMGFNRQEMGQAPENEIALERIRDHLVALGFQEVVTYSFIEPGLAGRFSFEAAETVELRNPISRDMSVMRGSLMPGLVQTLRYNVNRRQEHLRLFETGLAFGRTAEGFHQQAMLAGLIAGGREPKNWNNSGETADFFDAKGDLESLFDLGGRTSRLRFAAAARPGLHPGQCAEILLDGERAGYIGALHPALQREFELPAVFLFEVELDALCRQEVPAAAEPSRFPEVSRDLAIVIDEEFEASDIERTVRDAAGPLLASLRVLDVYRGGAVPAGSKSIALGLTWQHPSRTLGDAEIDQVIDSTIKALQTRFNASLRN